MDNKLPSWLNIHLNLFSRQNMHHAFLISGRKGLGKNQLIFHLSSLVLCDSDKDEVCGECHSCKLSSLENHPDFHELKVLPDKKLVGIGQIHDLRNKLYESSFLGKNKVASVPLSLIHI